jgi:hypothetical protein
MSELNPASSSNSIRSSDYSALAAVSDLADHRYARKKIVFQAIDLSGGVPVRSEPLGSRNPAPLLEEVSSVVPRNQVVAIPKMAISIPKKAETQELPPVLQVAEGAPRAQEALPAPVVQAAAESPPKVIYRESPPPAPQSQVTFVGEIADTEIPCFDVSIDQENGFLGLIIKADQRLKLKADQRVTIRINDAEGIYWFTGISVPITVLGATALVFGIDPSQP